MYLSDNNMTVIDLQNLEVDKFKLGKSGRAIKLFYDKEPVQICTSTMYLPFGVKSVSKEWSNYSEYNMDCFLNNSTSDISITFRESIEKLDCSYASDAALFNAPSINVLRSVLSSK